MAHDLAKVLVVGHLPLHGDGLLGGEGALRTERGVFFINVPVAAAVLAITLWRVPESRDEEARKLDLPGAALAAAGLAFTVFGLLESSRVGLGDPLVVGVVALRAFLVVEARGLEPIVPLSLFRSRNFAGANVFTLLFYFALGGTLFFLLHDLRR